jgi:hypothetical protein
MAATYPRRRLDLVFRSRFEGETTDAVAGATTAAIHSKMRA